MNIKDLKIGFNYWVLLRNGNIQIQARFVKINPKDYWGGRLMFKTDSQLILGDNETLKPSFTKHKAIPTGLEYINCTKVDDIHYIGDVLVTCDCGFTNQFDNKKNKHNCIDCGLPLVSVAL